MGAANVSVPTSRSIHGGDGLEDCLQGRILALPVGVEAPWRWQVRGNPEATILGGDDQKSLGLNRASANCAAGFPGSESKRPTISGHEKDIITVFHFSAAFARITTAPPNA